MAADESLPTGAPPAGPAPAGPRPAPAPRPAGAGPRPAPAPRPVGTPVAAAAAPRQRPDPRPMRLALGAGTIAAVSIMAAGLVRFPAATGDTSGDAIAADAAAADAATVETLATARPEVRIKHKTVYVHLKPGQKAPRGARVITGKAPPPRVVVTSIPAKAATTRTVRPATRRVVVVTRTRQSGH